MFSSIYKQKVEKRWPFVLLSAEGGRFLEISLTSFSQVFKKTAEAKSATVEQQLEFSVKGEFEISRKEST